MAIVGRTDIQRIEAEIAEFEAMAKLFTNLRNNDTPLHNAVAKTYLEARYENPDAGPLDRKEYIRAMKAALIFHGILPDPNPPPATKAGAEEYEAIMRIQEKIGEI